MYIIEMRSVKISFRYAHNNFVNYNTLNNEYKSIVIEQYNNNFLIKSQIIISIIHLHFFFFTKVMNTKLS